MHSYFFVFGRRVSLSEIRSSLENAALATDASDELIEVEHSGVHLELGIASGPAVEIEARELAHRLGVDELAGFDRRIEVMIDDLDAALQEFNTLAVIQQVLLDLTQGITWLQWNDGVLRAEPSTS